MTESVVRDSDLASKPSKEALNELNDLVAGRGPQGILKWAIDTFKQDLRLACSFGGISGMALLDMTVKLDPQIQVFYLDTGFLFPETYALRDKVAQLYQIEPVGFRPALNAAEQAAVYGDALWLRDPDKCCNIRKVVPNQAALKGARAWIAGLRRDQSNTRQQVRAIEWDSQFNLYKINPLWDWTEEMVWTYIQVEEVPYNPLHDQGYPSLGCTNCTRPVAAGEDKRAGRWSGTGKIECGIHRP